MGHRLPAVAVIAAPAAPGLAPTAHARADFVPAGTPVAGSFPVSSKETVHAAGAASHALTDKCGGRVKTVFTAAMHGFLVKDLTDAQARRPAADPAVERV